MKIYFASSALVWLLCSSAQADIINVPGDQPTIQAGIDSALNGDEVVIAPGLYNELIDFMGKAITLRSTVPTDPSVVAATIIDGTGLNGSVVSCVSSEGPDSVLSGFTITVGTGSLTGTIVTGGGMLNRFSSPSVFNCIFRENTAYFGGGMYNASSGAIVKDCLFLRNTPDFGGGMYNSGGGVQVFNCTFRKNTARSGGAMYNISSVPSLTNCVISGNITQTGSAMISVSGAHPTLTNCTVNGNRGPSGFYSHNCSLTLRNCILWENGGSGSDSHEIFINNSLVTVNHCNVQGGVPIEAIDNGGNIDADPQFIDADGPDDIFGTDDDDLRLLAGSPCLHAGDVTSLPADTADLDIDDDISEPVPLDLDELDRMSGPNVDMGAYEFQVPCPADVSPPDGGDGVVNVSDLLVLLGVWGPCAPPCPVDLNDDGDVNVPDLIALLAAWGACP